MLERNKTLHRVQVKLIKQKVACPLNCERAETGLRCNKYWEKCAIYKEILKDVRKK